MPVKSLNDVVVHTDPGNKCWKEFAQICANDGYRKKTSSTPLYAESKNGSIDGGRKEGEDK